MSENPIKISNLNDFIFCPISIYYHELYDRIDETFYYSKYQIDGKKVHEAIDNGTYSSLKNILQGYEVYSEKYNLIGKIDTFNISTGELIERKKKVKIIYDGYIFQLYAQYFCLCEMGYNITKLLIHSYDDNKNYIIPLPEEDKEMKKRFEMLINDMNTCNIEEYMPKDRNKCLMCIYCQYCDRGLI